MLEFIISKAENEVVSNFLFSHLKVPQPYYFNRL